MAQCDKCDSTEVKLYVIDDYSDGYDNRKWSKVYLCSTHAIELEYCPVCTHHDDHYGVLEQWGMCYDCWKDADISDDDPRWDK